MATLKTKAQNILNEKTTKILPTNIKDGVQIFDVLGTYNGSNGIYTTINSLFGRNKSVKITFKDSEAITSWANRLSLNTEQPSTLNELINMVKTNGVFTLVLEDRLPSSFFDSDITSEAQMNSLFISCFSIGMEATQAYSSAYGENILNAIGLSTSDFDKIIAYISTPIPSSNQDTLEDIFYIEQQMIIYVDDNLKDLIQSSTNTEVTKYTSAGFYKILIRASVVEQDTNKRIKVISLELDTDLSLTYNPGIFNVNNTYINTYTQSDSINYFSINLMQSGFIEAILKETNLINLSIQQPMDLALTNKDIEEAMLNSWNALIDNVEITDYTAPTDYKVTICVPRNIITNYETNPNLTLVDLDSEVQSLGYTVNIEQSILPGYVEANEPDFYMYTFIVTQDILDKNIGVGVGTETEYNTVLGVTGSYQVYKGWNGVNDKLLIFEPSPL